jgi:hypothetical protein
MASLRVLPRGDAPVLLSLVATLDDWEQRRWDLERVELVP